MYSLRKPSEPRLYQKETKIAATENPTTFSSPTELKQRPSPNLQRPESTPLPRTSYYPTPLDNITVIPITTPTPLTRSGPGGWPDGKILNHPEHFVETHIINDAISDTLKLRSGPGTRFSILAEIPPDATNVSAFDKDQIWDGDHWWCPVLWRGFRGYISRAYLPQ
jgi:hypothetical protein